MSNLAMMMGLGSGAGGAVWNALDISSASYDSVSFSVNSQDTAPQGIKFNSDGTKMYIVGSTNDNVYQYSLSTAWDLSTASYDNDYLDPDPIVSDNSVKDAAFKPDGSKMYLLGDQQNTVYQFNTA